MKAIFTTLFCFFLAYLPAQAQTFNYTTEQHIKNVFSDENFVYYDIKFTTHEPETITFKWVLISNGLPNEWNYSLCDYPNCYVGIAPYGTMQTITKSEMEEGLEGFFKFNINPKTYGGGVVQIYLYDKDDYNRGDTVSIDVYNRDLVSISSNEHEGLTTYPNPANELLNVQFDQGGDKVLTLHNANGELVFETQTIADYLQINTQEFESGLYFMTVQTDQGIHSQRVSIIH